MKRVEENQFLNDIRGTQTKGPGRYLRSVVIFILAVMFVLCIGFFVFLANIETYNSLDNSDLKADGIVVLTGGFARLEPAVELLKQGRGERLLISGVNRTTSDRLLKGILNINDRLYDCCVDVDQDALDTIGNAVGTAHWASSKNYTDVIVVTNDYHMPRSLMELNREMTGITLHPYPVSNPSEPNEKLIAKLDRYRVLIGEYAKYLAAFVR